MWPTTLKYSTPALGSPLPLARPYTPPEHTSDSDLFSDQGYFSNPAIFGPPSTSPVQNALFSCLGHFEHLIQVSQPNEEQMEKICNAFEEMASILSAPEAQSRQSDDHLFPELDVLPDNSSSIFGSTESSPRQMRDSGYGSMIRTEAPPSLPEEYIQAVQSYIDGVQGLTQDLKFRLEEVKELNWIQREIIQDLRKQLHIMREAAKQKALEIQVSPPEEEVILSEEQTPELGEETPELEEEYVPRKEYIAAVENSAEKRKGFWASIGEALDCVGEMLLEW